MRWGALTLVALAALAVAWWARRRVVFPEFGLAEVETADWNAVPSRRVEFTLPADAAGAVFGAGAAVLEAVGQAVTRAWSPPATAAPYLEDIRRAEVRYALPEQLLARVLYQESRFRPDIINGTTRSSAGAVGIAQFMPATAAELGVDPLNPASAIDGAGRYLRRLFDRFGNWSEALAAYNWGQGNVARRGLEAAPAETRNYLAEIRKDVPV